MGGTDPKNITGQVIKSIENANWSSQLEIDVILGSTNNNYEQICELASQSNLNIIVSKDVSNFAAHILRADLAIGAGGTTTWERCCLGLPTMMILTAKNQEEIGKQLKAKGAVLLIEEQGTLTNRKITTAIDKLVNDIKKWREISSACFLITDGLGAKRVSIELDPPKSKDGKQIKLRPVTLDDVDMLLEWQSEPETRRYSHNSNVPTYEEHVAWLKNKLRQVGTVIELIMHGSEPAGVVRLDPINNEINKYLISIYVSPNKYRLGIGKSVLHIIKYLFSEAELIAEVHEDNLASKTLFSSVGFRKKKHKDIYIFSSSN